MSSFSVDFTNRAVMVLPGLLVGVLVAMTLVIYCWRRRHSTGHYTIEGKPSIPRQSVDVRVYIIPALANNKHLVAGITNSENQDLLPKKHSIIQNDPSKFKEEQATPNGKIVML